MTVTLLTGDVRDLLPTLPEKSVQTVVTSPPYWGLRDYGVPGQLGLEPTPEEYVANLVAVFREVRRVLADDGTLWCNLGDSYNAYNGNRGATRGFQGAEEARPALPSGYGLAAKGLKQKDLVGIPWMVAFALRADGWYLRSDIIWAKPNPMPESVRDRPTKAHEYLFLLTKQPRYFYDAEAIREPISESTIERWKGDPYSKRRPNGMPTHAQIGGENTCGANPNGRNRRTVWTIAPKPFPGAHFAVMPPALVEPCILAGTSEKGKCPACGAPWKRQTETNNPSKWAADDDIRGFNNNGRTSNPQSSKSLHRQSGGVYSTAVTTGWAPSCTCFGRWEEIEEPNPLYQPGDEWVPETVTRRVYVPGPDDPPPVPCVVLDLFGGSGTVAVVAERLGRDSILIDLNPEYTAMAERRIAAAAPPKPDPNKPRQLSLEGAAP